MIDDREREDWLALLESPGYQRLVAFAAEDMARHLDAALNDTDDATGLQRLRQVAAAKKAIERVLRHPKDRVKALAPRADVVVDFTRGGLG